MSSHKEVCIGPSVWQILDRSGREIGIIDGRDDFVARCGAHVLGIAKSKSTAIAILRSGAKATKVGLGDMVV